MTTNEHATRGGSVDPGVTDRHSVATVTLGISAFAVAQGLTYPLISLPLVERGVSELVIGLNAAAFMLGLGASVLVVPALAARLRAGQVIVAGLVGSAAVLPGFATLDALPAWFALRFALGFRVNAIYVHGEAWPNAATADAVRGRVSELYAAGMSAGFGLGPLAIPLLGTDDGLAFAACAVRHLHERAVAARSGPPRGDARRRGVGLLARLRRRRRRRPGRGGRARRARARHGIRARRGDESRGGRVRGDGGTPRRHPVDVTAARAEAPGARSLVRPAVPDGPNRRYREAGVPSSRSRISTFSHPSFSPISQLRT